MPKTRKPKRKTPITAPSLGGSSHSVRSGSSSSGSSHPQATRTTIRRFHVLIKRQAQLRAAAENGQGSAKGKDRAAAVAELGDIEREIEELGGLPAYQRMSTIGQGKDRGGGSEQVFISWMRELAVHERAKEKETRVRLLEVGALKPDNYAQCKAWIDVTPIDLHSQHPEILEQDFLLMDPEEHRNKWEAISLSLVLNFAPNARDRGHILRLAHTMLQPDGLLFVALPSPCVHNSRYMTPEHFQGLMSAVGFEQVRSRWKEGGKMAYWLFRRASRLASTTYQEHVQYQKKTTFRTGDRNNFVVLL